MDYGPLVREEIEAGEQLLRKLDDVYPIKVAFWLRASDDEGLRYLYIASDKITEKNGLEAYEVVGQIVDEIHSLYFSPFRVKLLRGPSRLTDAALDIASRRLCKSTHCGRRGGLPNLPIPPPRGP